MGCGAAFGCATIAPGVSAIDLTDARRRAASGGLAVMSAAPAVAAPAVAGSTLACVGELVWASEDVVAKGILPGMGGLHGLLLALLAPLLLTL